MENCVLCYLTRFTYPKDPEITPSSWIHHTGWTLRIHLGVTISTLMNQLMTLLIKLGQLHKLDFVIRLLLHFNVLGI